MINLSSMFAKSPFNPLRDHMDKVVESVAPLKPSCQFSSSSFFEECFYNQNIQRQNKIK